MVQAGILRRYLPRDLKTGIIWGPKIHKLQKTGSMALLQWFLGFVKKNRNETGWWLNQPLWKIWVKMGSSSPIFGVKIKNLWVATTFRNVRNYNWELRWPHVFRGSVSASWICHFWTWIPSSARQWPIHPWRLTWTIIPWRFGSNHFPF